MGEIRGRVFVIVERRKRPANFGLGFGPGEILLDHELPEGCATRSRKGSSS